MQIITPPHPIDIKSSYKAVFLAGSIEMGKAVEWQNYIINELKSQKISLLNPRRKDWDAGWEQSIDNPNFKGQVEWELEGLEKADLIIYYFSPHTQSPVTLLEFGLYARSGKVVVCCPDGFWRKGNIDIVCSRYEVKQVNQLEDLVAEIKKI